jgi:galactose-1-phosphate uridylyltransferase
MTSLVNAEPSTFEEAVKKKEWKEAMMEEYQSIMKNDVWEIVPRPEGKFYRAFLAPTLLFVTGISAPLRGSIM